MQFMNNNFLYILTILDLSLLHQHMLLKRRKIASLVPFIAIMFLNTSSLAFIACTVLRPISESTVITSDWSIW